MRRNTTIPGSHIDRPAHLARPNRQGRLKSTRVESAHGFRSGLARSITSCAEGDVETMSQTKSGSNVPDHDTAELRSLIRLKSMGLNRMPNRVGLPAARRSMDTGRSDGRPGIGYPGEQNGLSMEQYSRFHPSKNIRVHDVGRRACCIRDDLVEDLGELELVVFARDVADVGGREHVG